MGIPEDLLCLYSSEVERRDGTYVIEVPDREVSLGPIDEEAVYRVALFEVRRGKGTTSQRNHAHDGQSPPVDVGEQRTVDIKDIGEQGDGIARVERGYVVIVPDTELGERVTIEITDVRENLGFGEVIVREEYYE